MDVIVVNYNSADALALNLDSVMRFVGPGGRLLVVNNSPDECLDDVLKHVAGKTLVITPGMNLGFAGAVNEALLASESDVVLLANPDARVLSGSVTGIEHLLMENPDVACVGVRLVNADGSLQPSCKRMPTPFDAVAENLGLSERIPALPRARSMRMLDWQHDCLREVDAVCGAFVFVRRAALRDVGLLDARFFLYYEETDWMARARALGWKVLFDPSVTVEHISGTSSSISALALQLLLVRSEQIFIRKHFGRAAEVTVRVLLAVIEAVRIVRCMASRRRYAGARDAFQRLSVQVTGSPLRLIRLKPLKR